MSLSGVFRVNVYVCMYMCVCACVCMCVCVLFPCVCACVCACVSVSMCVCMCALTSGHPIPQWREWSREDRVNQADPSVPGGCQWSALLDRTADPRGQSHHGGCVPFECICWSNE